MPRTTSRTICGISTYALGGDLAGDVHEAGGDHRLDRDARLRVLLEHRVEDGVGDLVTDLVRVPLGHGLGREQAHVGLGHGGQRNGPAPSAARAGSQPPREHRVPDRVRRPRPWSRRPPRRPRRCRPGSSRRSRRCRTRAHRRRRSRRGGRRPCAAPSPVRARARCRRRRRSRRRSRRPPGPAAAARAPSSARMSTVSTSSSDGRLAVGLLLDLGLARWCAGGSRPRRRPSRRRRRPWPRRARRPAARRRSRRGRRRRPAGTGTSMFAATRVTRAPRARAACGQRDALPAGRPVAEEPDGVERLTGAAGGDDDVPARQVLRPVVRPARARPRRSPPARAADRDRCPSRSAGRRPGRARARRAPAGSRRSRRVAGCSHISVCIAGASSTGQRATSSVAVSRSSACPVAARASRSAVAGATITSSACLPTATCATWSTSSKTSVVTGCAGQRLPGGAPDELERRAGGDDADGVALPRAAGAAAGRPCRRRSRPRRRGRCAWRAGQPSVASDVSRPASISRIAIESGFSCGRVSTSGPTYSSRPSLSCE